MSAGVCAAQVVLHAHPGPANSGGSSGYAIFFDLEALRGPLSVTHLATANDAFANLPFRFEVRVRDGTALGGPVGSGAGSSPAGWTSLGIVQGVQGPVTEGISLDVDIPDISVVPGVVRGVALWFNYDWGPRFFSTKTGNFMIYEDGGLKLTTGDARTHPFTPAGIYSSRAALVGHLIYSIGASCYPNCDGSTAPAALNVNDFVCFQSAFAAACP